MSIGAKEACSKHDKCYAFIGTHCCHNIKDKRGTPCRSLTDETLRNDDEAVTAILANPALFPAMLEVSYTKLLRKVASPCAEDSPRHDSPLLLQSPCSTPPLTDTDTVEEGVQPWPAQTPEELREAYHRHALEKAFEIEFAYSMASEVSLTDNTAEEDSPDTDTTQPPPCLQPTRSKATAARRMWRLRAKAKQIAPLVNNQGTFDASTAEAPSAPSPDEAEDQYEIVIDVVHQTSFRRKLPEVLTGATDYVFFQETSLPSKQQPAVVAHYKEHSVQQLMGPTDPERVKPTGGVCIAAFVAQPLQPLPHQSHQHAAFTEANEAGRLGKHAIDIGTAQPLIVYNLYAWPCGNTSLTAARRNEALFSTVFHGIATSPAQLYAIVGDLNCTKTRSATFRQELAKRTVVDIGHLYGTGNQAEVSCRITSRSAGARRDYIQTNPALLPLIKQFEVKHSIVPTHAVLRLTLRTRNFGAYDYTCKPPASLAALHPHYSHHAGSDYSRSIQAVKDAMNSAFEAQEEELSMLLQRKRSNGFIALWGRIVENAHVTAHVCTCQSCRSTQEASQLTQPYPYTKEQQLRFQGRTQMTFHKERLHAGIPPSAAALRDTNKEHSKTFSHTDTHCCNTNNVH